MTPAQIRRQIMDTRKEMRELGIKRVSCFNRLEERTYRYNARLFQLSIDLKRAVKEEADHQERLAL